MIDASSALAAYDDQLRLEAEAVDSTAYSWDGPLLRVVFGSRGLVTYRDLDGVAGNALERVVASCLAYFRDQTDVLSFEWKTRGHDRCPELHDQLVAHGFLAGDVETVMVGEAAPLAQGPPPPTGTQIRHVGGSGDLAGDVAGLVELQTAVYGPRPGPSVDELLATISRDPGNRWIATSENEVIAAGRLDVVGGTEFAGLWGGVTHPEWRRRGLYRSLLTVRAQAGVAQGSRFLHSDCSVQSRPILERHGFVAITTSTPYVWTRPVP